MEEETTKGPKQKYKLGSMFPRLSSSSSSSNKSQTLDKPLSLPPTKSTLSTQLSKSNTEAQRGNDIIADGHNSNNESNSSSDVQANDSNSRKASAQLMNVLSAPFTPRRPPVSARLQLQMPARIQPLTPTLDPSLSPFAIARRPRLEFARACTSLHHSTLAESPDSSPLTPNSFPIPRRGLDSPTAANGGFSSLGSMSLMDTAGSGDDSDSSSNGGFDDDLDLESNPSSARHSMILSDTPSGLGSLMRRRHSLRLQGRPQPQRSSSTSASNSSLPSPAPTTPPISTDGRNGGQGGYFGKQLGELVARRRDSLSQAMKQVMFEAEEEERAQQQADAVKRPVTRRGSLLPKPKHFQRIRAELQEESAPGDTELRREAEITRQMREDDNVPITPITPLPPPHSNSVLMFNLQDDILDDGSEEKDPKGMSFKKQAQRNSGFWDSIESSSPPAFFGLKMNPDGDIVMGSDSIVNSPVHSSWNSPEVRRLKRRRTSTTDDPRFEPQPTAPKRRAVSPGVSQSPLASPMSYGNNNGQNGLKRFGNMQDTHDGLMKMSIGPSFGV